MGTGALKQRGGYRTIGAPELKEPMHKATYLKMTGALRSKPALAKGVAAANKAITYAIYFAYPALLAWLLFHNGVDALAAGAIDPLFAKALLVPASGFAALTVVRKAVNAPRPYEVFDTPPVIAKDTSGKSFPSRHVFSIFVIGTAFLFCCPLPWAGWAVFALGVCLAVVRVVSGVHFPKDVIAGALFALAWGGIGFCLL